METGIPWWAIFAAVIIFSALLAIFTTHSDKREALATLGDIQNELDARNLELQSMKKAAGKLDMEPLGTDGAEYAQLPSGTNLVKTPDGRYRLAIPVVLSVAFHGEMRGELNASVELTRRPEEGTPDYSS